MSAASLVVGRRVSKGKTRLTVRFSLLASRYSLLNFLSQSHLLRDHLIHDLVGAAANG